MQNSISLRSAHSQAVSKYKQINNTYKFITNYFKIFCKLAK